MEDHSGDGWMDGVEPGVNFLHGSFLDLDVQR